MLSRGSLASIKDFTLTLAVLKPPVGSIFADESGIVPHACERVILIVLPASFRRPPARDSTCSKVVGPVIL